MRISLFITVVGLVISCSGEETNNSDFKATLDKSSGFDSITVKKGLENSYLFDFMRNNRVRSQLVDLNDTTTEIASSNISLVSASDSLQDRVRATTIERCKAYMTPDSQDTIFINIYNGAEVGGGIKLKIIDKKFQALPYFSSHIVEPDRTSITILNQQLRLHQENFVVGDSIFGDLHLRAKEGSKNWFADGLFRAKIEKREKP